MSRQIRVLAALAGLGLTTIGAAQAREVVPFPYHAAAGSVVVSVSERRLYLVNGDGTAIRYPVAVGKPGKQWFGTASIDGKYVRPAWSPPWEVKRDNPRLPNLIAGGAPGNPMGAAALTLSGGQYAIHGTNRPSSIGTWASYGCIRMYNQDVVDLYERVDVGTPVTLVR
ncbi:L,D-transpeptidase [Methylobacterium symbioticum]|jgi:lipoprotein-anchoring transpeptidase ErfK/SrfK|uniref:Putative L,D-transpeptidase YbiS n=1 Tax=Methylobacterium symbioticum TaxID=2584084 RepID=A0A509EKU1_9HYPH|nr:L,D-transpeptidase [Methylobacterium symbioticum]VUD74109.1 putative L,D-transpeptidase YbiS [Methylobacterium symbioticum]